MGIYRQVSDWAGYKKDKIKVYINGIADSSGARFIGSVASGAGLASGVNGVIAIATPFIPQATVFTVARYSFVSLTFLIGTIMASAEIDLSVNSIKALKKEVAQLKKDTLSDKNQIKYLAKKLASYESSIDVLSNNPTLTPEEQKELSHLKQEREKIILRSDSLSAEIDRQKKAIITAGLQDIELDTLKEYTPAASIAKNGFFSSSTLKQAPEEKQQKQIVTIDIKTNDSKEDIPTPRQSP